MQQVFSFRWLFTHGASKERKRFCAFLVVCLFLGFHPQKSYASYKKPMLLISLKSNTDRVGCLGKQKAIPAKRITLLKEDGTRLYDFCYSAKEKNRRIHKIFFEKEEHGFLQLCFWPLQKETLEKSEICEYRCEEKPKGGFSQKILFGSSYKIAKGEALLYIYFQSTREYAKYERRIGKRNRLLRSLLSYIDKGRTNRLQKSVARNHPLIKTIITLIKRNKKTEEELERKKKDLFNLEELYKEHLRYLNKLLFVFRSLKREKEKEARIKFLEILLKIIRRHQKRMQNSRLASKREIISEIVKDKRKMKKISNLAQVKEKIKDIRAELGALWSQTSVRGRINEEIKKKEKEIKDVTSRSHENEKIKADLMSKIKNPCEEEIAFLDEIVSTVPFVFARKKEINFSVKLPNSYKEKPRIEEKKLKKKALSSSSKTSKEKARLTYSTKHLWGGEGVLWR